MMVRNGMILALLLAAVTLVSGCRQEDDGMTKDGRKRITFLTMQLRPTFDDYFNSQIAAYEEAHPDVKIEWLDFPYQNYANKLLTSFMSGNPPDVINLPSDSMQDYDEPGYLLALQDQVSQEVLDSYVPTLLDSAKVDEDLYGLPWYASSGVTMINRQIFEEAGLDPEQPPELYDNLAELARVIKEKAGKFAIFPPYTEAGTIRMWMTEAGIPILNEDKTKAAFNTPRGLRIFKFWTDLYKNGLVPSEALTATHRRPIELYKTGQLAMLASGPQFLRQVKSDAPEIYENTVVGPLMRWEEDYAYNVALHTMAVASATKHPEEAVDFAIFMTDATRQLEFCKLTSVLPSVTSALNDPYFLTSDGTPEGDGRMISARHVKEGKTYPFLPNQRDILPVFDSITEDVSLGKMTAEEGLNLAEEKVNEILDKN